MQKINFQDLPSTSTPLNASTLNQMQDNIESAIEDVESVIPTIENSLDSDSTTNGASVHATKLLNTYSTNELKIGTWIDGKPIYRKVFTGNKGNDDLNLGTVSSNLDTVTDEYGILTDTSNNKKKLPYYYSSSVWISMEVNSSKNLVVYGSTSQFAKGSVTMVVEYTKTTD